jgi:hypothetical protein
MLNTKFLFIALIVISITTQFVSAQQWGGAGNQTGAIWRNGNIGIGTTTPSARFDVRGSVRISQNLFLTDPLSNKSLDGKLILANGLDKGLVHSIGIKDYWTEFRSHSNEGWRFLTGDNDSTHLLLRGLDGYLGIGTTDPTEKIDVNGNARFRGFVLRHDGADFVLGANDGRPIGANPSQRALVHWLDDQLVLNFNGDFEGGVGVGGKNFTVAGNVGIGNFNPNAPLQFPNDLRNRKIVLWDSGNDDHQYYGFGINGATLRYQVDGPFSNHIFFAGNGSSASKELMRLDGNGNLSVRGFTLQHDGADFILGANDGRNIGVKPLQRALVHGLSDDLVLNFAGDFEGGVFVDGNRFTNRGFTFEHQGADFILGTNDGRSIGAKPLQRALIHGNFDDLVVNFAGDFEGGVFVDGPFLKTRVLTIIGGADIAEPFDIVSEKETTIEAGSVVVIDENNPGQLKLSQSPYDKKVAGIISGANGINPGLVLQQEGKLEGKNNVALSGRVYVKANNTNGDIQAGDFITTSSIVGEAMKVTDYQKAQGAILGKAMTGLKDKSGFVLVLVTLQ